MLDIWCPLILLEGHLYSIMVTGCSAGRQTYFLAGRRVGGSERRLL